VVRPAFEGVTRRRVRRALPPRTGSRFRGGDGQRRFSRDQNSRP
jgi:hypothetical protein